jgi:hypothetical protein
LAAAPVRMAANIIRPLGEFRNCDSMVLLAE